MTEDETEEKLKDLKLAQEEEEEEEEVEATGGDQTSQKKKKKKKKKKKTGAAAVSAQTEPPTIPVEQLFPKNEYPVGEEMDYKDEYGNQIVF
jgi:methionyl aminopeptidase